MTLEATGQSITGSGCCPDVRAAGLLEVGLTPPACGRPRQRWRDTPSAGLTNQEIRRRPDRSEDNSLRPHPLPPGTG
jgi:hypothetical protein